MEQISLLPTVMSGEDIDDLKRQVEQIREYDKAKRRWEDAFQRWSNSSAYGKGGGSFSYGCCGYGSMCDWCEDNSYGRPCVRALNAMCREKRIQIDYSDYDFKKVWIG